MSDLSNYSNYEQPGLLRPSDISLFMFSPLATTARYGQGFVHDIPEGAGAVRRKWGRRGATFGGPRTIREIVTGLSPQTVALRKLTGVTWSNKQYMKLSSRKGMTWLRDLGPTLSHLGPSRYLTLWAALSGSEGAMQTLRGMAAINDVLDPALRGGIGYADAIKGAFQDKNMAGINFFKAMGKNLNDARFSAKTPMSITWGSVFRGTYDPKAFALAQAQMEGARIAWAQGGRAALSSNTEDFVVRQFLEATGFKGSIGRTVGGFYARHVGIRQNPMLMALGRNIPMLARAGGTAIMGIDLYHMGKFLGGGVGKAVIAGMQAPMGIYGAITSDIHRGTFMSSSPLSPFTGATARQRAMSNIYEKQLNLKQVMGNEAPFLSRQWGF